MASVSPLSTSRSRAYWRIVSRRRYRVALPRSTTTSERSTSKVRASRTARVSGSPSDRRRQRGAASPQTAAAASSVQPPENTDRRRSRRRSSSGQQVPAPVDERLERLLARQGGPPAAGQQPEPVAQALEDLADGQDRHARRGQLDGQRDAVETLADLGHDRRIGGRQLEPGATAIGALGEESHRVRGGQGLERPGCGGLVVQRALRRERVPARAGRVVARPTTGPGRSPRRGYRALRDWWP